MKPLLIQNTDGIHGPRQRRKDGKLDHNKALGGEDLKDFVDKELFPYLKKFHSKAEGPDTIEYKIGEIFGEIKNKLQSGNTLREILNIIDNCISAHKKRSKSSPTYTKVR